MDAPDIRSIIRFVPLDKSLATAGQPTEAQLALIAGAGFEVIINLALHNDPRYSLPDEASTVRSLGMEYVHIPVQFAAPRAEDLAAFFAAMDHAGGRKTLVHCAHNKRVPVFIALYRIIRQNWNEPEALQAMRQVWEPDAVWENFIAQSLIGQPG